MGSQVTTQVDGHVLLIGVDRAAKRNAWTSQTLREVAESYQVLATTESLRAGLLFGHGDHFSAGLDLGDFAGAFAERGPQALGVAGLPDPFGMWGEPVAKPIVLAVQGFAYTLAIELALASDVTIAADDVRFRQAEVGRGIIPMAGATLRAPLQLGWGNAMRFLLTGEEFGSAEALRIGLVQEVVPAGQQLERALVIARLIAEQAPLAVQATLANARLRMRNEGDLRAKAHLQSIAPAIINSEDAAEGLQSFQERRPAQFSGR
jgi:enoyl-CoA hydratase/carnithine racemase